MKKVLTLACGTALLATLGAPAFAGQNAVDHAALAEERPQPRECNRHQSAKGEKDNENDRREAPVEREQDSNSDDGSEQSADELNQTRSNQIPHAFGVSHDARNEDAGFRRVEV